MAPYCVCLQITLSLYVFPCVSGNPFGKIVVYACLILSLALAVWSLFACYSHFVGLTEVTVVHKETMQLMYPWIPLGKPLGKLSTLIYPRLNGMRMVCMHFCIPGKPLGKLLLCTCEPQPRNLCAPLCSMEASGQDLPCMLILHLKMW